MYAIDPKWRQTPVTAYICFYQELNLKIVEYTHLPFDDFYWPNICVHFELK